MQLTRARDLAEALLAEHGLPGWRFAFDHARARCGSCHYGKRRITLSRHFVPRNDETEVKDVILHEIAHALAGPRAAHGEAWRRIARQIGARPQASAPVSVDMPDPAWALVCAACTRVVARRQPLWR